MKIGKSLKKGFKKLGKGIKKIAKTGGKILSKVTKTMGKILKPFGQVVGGVLSSFPGGALLGGLIGGFGQNPCALQSPGYLGALGNVMGGCSNAGQLANYSAMVSQSASFSSPQGQYNFSQMIAYSQARFC